MNEEYLKKNALWIIMDPWEKHPYPKDFQKCPNIDLNNDEMVKKIAEILPEITYAVTSCLKQFPVHPLLQHLPNLHDSDRELKIYMTKNNLKDIVYIGFHHGRCILNRRTGAIRTGKNLKCNLWLKRELVGVLSYDDPEVMDEKSKNYLTFF